MRTLGISRAAATVAATALMLGSAAGTSAQAAQLRVGFITSLSGPVSSIGIPYSKGMKAAESYVDKVRGMDIKVYQLDDASDPTTAARDARKLVDDDKVDVLIGSSGVPSAMAVAAVASQTGTPMIGVTPIAGKDNPWVVTTVQPVSLMVGQVVAHMKKDGVKTVAYIGFSDSWGDLVYANLKKYAAEDGIKVLTDERYARSDNSVTGQALRMMATHPDAVLTGGSGTPGALPYLALSQLGYTGKIYGTYALISPDFVRVAGSSAEGMLSSTGPVIVADQLPADYPTRAISLVYRNAYKKVNGSYPDDAFSAYAFDAWLVLVHAADKVDPKLQPGTPAYRKALRDAIFATHELDGTMGVFNFHPGSPYGVDKRACVIVRLEHGQWKYAP